MIPYVVRQEIKALPGMLALHAALRGNAGDQLAGREKRLCIEGFPRSGNSFALTCVRERLGIPQSRIAHHTHSIANVRRAAALALPTYVLVREPQACCESLVLWGGARTVGEALAAYRAYHRSLPPLLDRVTVVPFETLTAAPGAWLDLVAADLGLPPTIWDEEVSAEIRAMLRRGDQRRRVEGRRRRSLPDAERPENDAAIDPPASPLLEQCRELREAILERAPRLLRAGDSPGHAR